MTNSLVDFISSIRLADSIEQEKFLIASEQADLRTYVRECDPQLRPRIVSKLLFLNILGENVSYGTMESITLMSNPVYSFKRIGYIATAVILDESSEISVLLTHTISQDLQNSDFRVQCLALAYVANNGTSEICRSVASEVQKLTESNNPSVMKRAAMASARIVERVPELAENFKTTVQKLLKHGSHGVVIAAINLMDQILQKEPSFASSWGKYAPAFTKILKQLNCTKPSREFQFTVFNDPFLQIRLMKILSRIHRSSEDLDDVLESIATGVEIRRNSGRALLFQAVETIVSTAKKPTLRALAFAQVGRLFKFKESNVLYSALSVFSRVLYSGREIIDRTSGDSIALQRFKTQIVQCLSHRDGSIRRRALDVISALVDEKNCTTLIPEVLNFVNLADAEFRVELVAKIFTAVQRFAPTPQWNFDTVHRILVENGNYVGSDLITQTCKLISNDINLQQHAVQQLGGSLLNFSENQSLIQVSAWTLGEFAMKDDGYFDALERILRMPQTSVQTKGYVITGIAKLAVRFDRRQDASKLLEEQAKSSSLDVQQRAGELSILLSNNDLSEEVLAPADLPDNENSQTTATLINTDSKSSQNQSNIGPVLVNTQSNDDDLLLSLDVVQPPTKSNATPTTTNNNTQSLLDLLSDSTPTQNSNAPQNSTTTQNTTQNSNTPQNTNNTQNLIIQNIGGTQIKLPSGAKEAMRKSDYVMYFEIKKNPQNPKLIAIRSSVFNLSKTPFDNFQVKYGVPQGWFVKASAASGNRLEAAGGPPILQQLLVSTQTAIPLQMKVQISYKYGTQPIMETGEINPIFG